MSDLLESWIEKYRTKLEAEGFKITIAEPHIGGGRSVELDSDSIIGGVCHWPPERFEFQFHSLKSGDILVLEEMCFRDVGDLSAYFEELRKGKLLSG